MQIGQNLVSNSENDKKTRRRNLSFDPFAGEAKPRQTNFGAVKDFATNAVFNVVDAALFNVPSGLLEAEETKPANFWEQPEMSYGEGFDAFGIKPYESLSKGGRFGYGLGQALGFFIPYSKISKGTSLVQRAAVGNFDDLLTKAVKESSTGINFKSTDSLTSLVKDAIGKNKTTIPQIYRSTPEQYAQFSNQLSKNIRNGISKGLTESKFSNNPAQIESAANNIVQRLEQFGKDGKYIDNLGDYITDIFVNDKTGTVARNVYGYVGRAIDQGMNMAIYDGLGRMSRAATGTQIEGVDDQSLAESLTHSAGFAAAISIADFIPGGRKAGAAQDFYRYARHNLKNKRSFSELSNLYKTSGGKQGLGEKEIRSLAAYFGTLSKSSVKGNSVSDIAAGRGSLDDIVKWLDNSYSSNRKELLRALFKDTGKSLVGSLPRAGVDAAITAQYMGLTGDQILNDESLISDYLVGAFMAMRAYQPLDPRGRTPMGGNAYRWRYDNSIDAKFNFMEQMGMDTEALKEAIPYMRQGTQEADLISKNLQMVPGYEEIYTSLYDDVEYNPLHNDSKSGMQKERAFLNDLNILFTPSLLRDPNKSDVNTVEDIEIKANSGEYYDIYNLPDSKVKELWDKISTVQTSEGKTLSEYQTFDSFMEDFQRPIANYHMNNSLASARDFAEAVGLLTGDTLSDSKNGLMTVKDFSIDDINNIPDDALYMLRLIRNLSSVRNPEGVQRVKIEPGTNENITNAVTDNIDRIKQITEKYNEETASALESSFQFTNAENPSFNFLSRYTSLSNKNKLEDAIFDIARDEDPSQQRLVSHLRNIFEGGTVSHRIKYEVSDPEKDKDGGISKEQYRLKDEAQEIIDNLYDMKMSAGQVSNEPGPVKKIKFDDAIGLAETLKSTGVVRDTEFGKMYGDSFFSQIVNDLQRRDFLRLGLDETDYIAYRVIEQSSANKNGEINMLTNTEDVEALIRSYLSDDGRVEVNDRDVGEYVSNYMGVVRRLSKTGKIKEFPSSANMTKRERERMLQAVEYVHQVYENKLKTDAKSLVNFSNKISDKVNEITKEVNQLQNDFKKGKLNNEDFVDKSIEMLSKLNKSEEGFMKIVPYSDADFVKLQDDIESKRNAGLIDGALAERLFNDLNSVHSLGNYNESVTKLSNTLRSMDAWSSANMTLRNKLVNELMGKFDMKREDLSSKNVVELINDLTREAGDYESAKIYIDNIRKSTASVYGYSRGMLDYNSDVSVSSMKEFLDMMSANHERSNNVQSFIKRMEEMGITDYISDDNKQLSADLVSKLSDVENFRENISDVVNKIKEVDSKRFNNDNDAIVHELFSVVQSVLIRNESRTFTSIEQGRAVTREENNLPRTQTMDFIDSMKRSGLRVDEIKNEYVNENGNIQRFSDFDGNYKSIENLLMSAYRNVIDRSSDFVKEQEQLLKEGKISESQLLAAIKERDPDATFMSRPVFVDLKASDDMGVVFDLTRQNATKLLDKFDEVDSVMREGADAERLDFWDGISNQIRSSLKKLSDNPEYWSESDDGNTIVNDLRASIRSIYVAENFGKDYFWQMVGTDVESQMKNQSKLFKTLHHIDNTNAISLNKENENVLATLLDVAGTNQNHRLVAKEALRRANEGVRVAVYNDDADTAGKMLEPLIRNHFEQKYKRELATGDMQLSTLDNIVDKYLETTLNEIDPDGSLNKSISLDNPITDGSVYMTGDAMRHDVHVMGREFDISNEIGSNGRSYRTGGVRASKIAMHSAKAGEKNIIAKMAGRYDPVVSKMLKDLGIDYLVPSSQSKLFMGKESAKSIKDYDPLKPFDKNLRTAEIGKKDVNVYDPELVKYMFAGHGFDHISKSNASVTHYWDLDALRRYSEKLNMDSTARDIVNGIEAFTNNSYDNDLGKLLIQKYNRIKNSGDYSHLGVIEQFVQWGIESNHSFIRGQVMRHIRDLALTDVASVNNNHVSNTFLFSNSELMNPIFNRDNQVSRLGEMYLSSGMESVLTDGDLSIVLNHSDQTGLMSDYVFGRENGNLRRKQTAGDDLLPKEINEKMDKLFSFLLNKDYGTVNTVLDDINNYINHIADGKKPENVLKLVEQSYRNMANDMFDLAKSLHDAGASDLNIAVNTHKIPKKFGPDSVVNRVRGFVDPEKGNVNELNNYEITMQHQADQDGDKITVYGNNPVSSLHKSIDNMSFGREATVFETGENPTSPNIFNYFSANGSVDRTVPNQRNSINKNNTLSYISQERKSKFVVGSVVKMQGVMTMLNNVGLKHFGQRMKNITGTDDMQFSRNYHRVTGSVIQSVLDAWSGVNPAFLNIRNIKDFILFGDTPDGLNITGNKLFESWAGDGGIFGEAIRNFSDENSVREVQKDIIREYVRVFENAYSVFGDSYEGGARIKPSFDTLNSVYRSLSKIENNDFSSVYRTLRARYYKRSNRDSLLNALDNAIMSRRKDRSSEAQSQIVSIDNKPTTFYPQLIALRNFVLDDRGFIRSSMVDDPETMIKNNDFANKIFNDYNLKTDIDGEISSDLRINNKILNGTLEDLENFLQKDGNYNTDAPKQIGVYRQVLQAQINTLKRRKNYYDNVKDVEGSRDVERDIRYYEDKLRDTERKIESLQMKHIDSGKAMTFGKDSKPFDNNTGNVLYAYKINYGSDRERASYEFSKVIKENDKGVRFYSDHVLLRNPVEMVSVDNLRAEEGLAMESATNDYLSNLYRITDSQSVRRFNDEARLLIERTKAQIRNVDSEAYDLIKDAPGLKNDAYEDARTHVDILFRKMVDDLNNMVTRIFADDQQAKTEVFNSFTKMLLSPRVVGNRIAKDKDTGIHMPYFKNDNKFVTHLVRYINDYPTDLNSVLLSTNMRDIFNKNLNTMNKQASIVGDPRTANTMFNTAERMKEYQFNMNDERSLFRSLERLAGRYYEASEFIRRDITDRVNEEVDGTITVKTSSEKDGELQNKCWRNF